MSGYFDASQASDDLKLLPTHLRRDENLETLAAQVEAEIVAHYTTSTFDAPAYAWQAVDGWDGAVLVDGPGAGAVKLTDYLYVRLRGYAPDGTLAEAYFKEAMRREMADVLRWRLTQAKRNPAIASESDGDKSVTYVEDAAETFPASFPLYLRPFVVVDGSWSL